MKPSKILQRFRKKKEDQKQDQTQEKAAQASSQLQSTNPWGALVSPVTPEPLPPRIRTLSFPRLPGISRTVPPVLRSPKPRRQRVKFRVPGLKTLKRVLACFLLLVWGGSLLMVGWNMALPLFLATDFILLDYLWKTRRPPRAGWPGTAGEAPAK